MPRKTGTKSEEAQREQKLKQIRNRSASEESLFRKLARQYGHVFDPPSKNGNGK